MEKQKIIEKIDFKEKLNYILGHFHIVEPPLYDVHVFGNELGIAVSEFIISNNDRQEFVNGLKFGIDLNE